MAFSLGVLNSSYAGQRVQMTKDQFKEWLKRVDADGDGRISRQELRTALKGLGLRCPGWKAWRGVLHADLNHNGYVDGDREFEELAKYAVVRWGIIVI